MDETIASEPKVEITPEGYLEALKTFDAAVCEACAISQAIGRRNAEAHAGYAANFFARICSHAVSMIRALPHSRWVVSDFDHWDFGAIAGHTRAIVEGHLTFMYLAEAPESKEQWSAKLNVMHLCDCTRRISLFRNLDDEEQAKSFEESQTELQDRLRKNPYFMALPEATRKKCLNGKFLTLTNRDELVKSAGWDTKQFNAYFDLLSQNTHILTMSFYRMEPEGRGTGIENDSDRSYMATAMLVCSAAIQGQIDRLIELFPDIKSARSGINSKFSPGPKANLPSWRLERALSSRVSFKKRRSKTRKGK